MMEKELTRLWYEFLKRSDSYRDFIKANRPITKAKRNPVDLANSWGNSGKDPVLLGHTLNLWKFGDVFRVPFEKWHDREREGASWAAVETKNYLATLDWTFELPLRTVGPTSIYEHPTGLKYIMENPDLQVVNISVDTTASDKDIHDAVRRIVNRHKTKVIPALESLTDYLLTYDEYQKGLSEADIAKAILPKQNNFVFNEAINRIRLYYKNACTIIRNVESGNIPFPGKY